MIPTHFPECNRSFGPPSDLQESQCATIKAFGGSCDGVPMTIVAWKPTPQELEAINGGALVYLTCIGGLPPHFLTTSFEQAKRPA